MDTALIARNEDNFTSIAKHEHNYLLAQAQHNILPLSESRAF